MKKLKLLSASFIMFLTMPLATYASNVEGNQERLSAHQISAVAVGHEEIYNQFLKGSLIYYEPLNPHDPLKPLMPPKIVVLPIANLKDPLNGEFDLSACGIFGQHISINTGYRTGRRPENSNKLEIWITPKFLIDEKLASSASQFQPIMKFWNTRPALPVCISWTWGGWENMNRFDYFLSSLNKTGFLSLFDKHGAAGYIRGPSALDPQNIEEPHDIYSDKFWPAIPFRISFEPEDEQFRMRVVKSALNQANFFDSFLLR